LAYIDSGHIGFPATPPKRDTCTKHATPLNNALQYGCPRACYTISYQRLQCRHFYKPAGCC
ncbi:hypothetical protein P154DRAFT_605486, partial [Amniculicola lignicola CBS 123094]